MIRPTTPEKNVYLQEQFCITLLMISIFIFELARRQVIRIDNTVNGMNTLN